MTLAIVTCRNSDSSTAFRDLLLDIADNFLNLTNLS